jgi:hypothetical protein
VSTVLVFCQIVYSTWCPDRSAGSFAENRYEPFRSGGSVTEANGCSGRSDQASGFVGSYPGSVRNILKVPVCGIVDRYVRFSVLPGDRRVEGQSARARSSPL